MSTSLIAAQHRMECAGNCDWESRRCSGLGSTGQGCWSCQTSLQGFVHNLIAVLWRRLTSILGSGQACAITGWLVHTYLAYGEITVDTAQNLLPTMGALAPLLFMRWLLLFPRASTPASAWQALL